MTMRNITSIVTRWQDFAPTPSFPSLTPEQVREVEQRIGRVLTPAEVISGSLLRKGHSFGPFRPKMAASSEDSLDASYREAKKAARDEELRLMSPAKRTLAIIEDAKAERDARELRAKSHEEKLKHFEPILQQIEAKLLAARFDETVGYDELQQLWYTRQAILTEGACPVAAQELFSACLDNEKQRILGRRSEVGAEADRLRAKVAALEGQIKEFDVALGDSAPAVSRTAELQSKWYDLYQKSEGSAEELAAWKELKAAKAEETAAAAQ